MATIKQMLDFTGSCAAAEQFARDLVIKNGPHFLLDLSLILAHQGKFDESWEVLQRALSCKPSDRRAIYNSGSHYMMEGQLLEGFKRLNEGRHEEIFGSKHIGSIQPIWEGQDLDGKTILINMEAGLGDQVIFIRFAENLSKLGAKVVVSCDPHLAPVFVRIPAVSAASQYEAALGIFHDYWIPSMMLPVPLKIEYEDLNGSPYLTANSNYVNHYRNFIKSDKLKVGIRWLGRDGDDYIGRVFPPELLFEAVNQEHVEVYSLQKDNPLDLAAINDLQKYLKSWEDTIGIIQNLDLIITSCTSIAHISAALGKPTWVIVPILSYFIWAYPGNKSPWYDSVTLFRQETIEKWEEPFNKISKELKNVQK